MKYLQPCHWAKNAGTHKPCCGAEYKQEGQTYYSRVTNITYAVTSITCVQCLKAAREKLQSQILSIDRRIKSRETMADV